MTQLFFKETVSQRWRLNPITKLEEINLSLSCHLCWKDRCWQTTYLFSGRFWTAVQKHPGLLLSCTFLGHQTLLWQGVTSVLIFSAELHHLWWSGGNRGGKSLQNKITRGKNFQNGIATYHMKMQMGDGQHLNLLSWGKHEARFGNSTTILVVLEGSATEHQTSSGYISASDHTTGHPCSG